LLLGRLRISHLKNPISISVTATLLFMIFGGFFAIDQYTFVLKYFSYIFEGVLLYLLFTIVTRKKNYLTESFVGFGIIGVILSFLTIIEAIVGKDLFLNVIEMSSRSGQFRPGGPIGHGLPLAATIAISFFPVFYCFSSAKTKFKKIIYATFLGIQIIAVLFTLSRSVIIGLIFALITFVFIQIYLRGLFKQLFKIFVYLVFISLIILLLIFLIPNVYNAITNIFSIDYLYRDTSIKDRLIVFEWVSYMINNTKGLGVGLGNFPIFVSLYFSPYNLYPDNEFLRILGESGIPGIISFILVLILSIKKLFSTFEKRKDNYSKQISIYLLSSLVCLIICLFGFDLLGFQASAAVFWLILALITNL
jgi:O-antigen ligase